MKHISELVNFNPNAIANPKSIPVDDHASDIINDVFTGLKSIFPAWRQAFSDRLTYDAAKRQWTQALAENGIVTNAQIEMGFKAARNSSNPFFPSVGQFIKWCEFNPENLGLPSAESAFAEAPNKIHFKNATWSHVAVQVAAIATGKGAFSELGYNQCFEVFKRNYEIICRRYAEGVDLNEYIPLALPKKVHIPTTKNKSLKNISNLKNLLKGKATA